MRHDSLPFKKNSLPRGRRVSLFPGEANCGSATCADPGRVQKDSALDGAPRWEVLYSMENPLPENPTLYCTAISI